MIPKTNVIIKASLNALIDFMVFSNMPDMPMDMLSDKPNIIPFTNGFPGKLTKLNSTM